MTKQQKILWLLICPIIGSLLTLAVMRTNAQAPLTGNKTVSAPVQVTVVDACDAHYKKAETSALIRQTQESIMWSLLYFACRERTGQ